MIAIDLFSGAGGLSEGLEQAGIEVVMASELKPSAAATYKINHPKTQIVVGDIRNLDASKIKSIVGKNIDLVCGGPPCAGFSMLGKRNPSDPRNRLFREFVRIVDSVKPEFFLMENVEGILTMQNGLVIKKIEESFEEKGYKVSKKVFDASEYGVPQQRKRVFIFGSLSGLSDINQMNHARKYRVSVEDAISDLDFLSNGESSTEYRIRPRTKYQKGMRKGAKKLSNHETSEHNAKVTKRFSMIKCGASAKSLPKKYRTGKKIMYRLDAKKPSRTVTTMPDDIVHYNRDRILSVRELARIQSFDDSYVFLGPRTSGGPRRKVECPQYTQVGNSVPPLLAKAFGNWLKNKDRVAS